MFRPLSATALLAVCMLPCAPQTPHATPAGLEAPWDARRILTDLVKNTAELGPVIQQLNPQSWVKTKGAPSTYILQWQTAERQLTDVSTVANQLAQKTENLPLSLDLYFRMEALDVTARSLNEGVQKYADRTAAAQLNALIARNFDNRERFRGYIRDLATSLDQNFKIADEEAQRCRGTISKEPPPSPKARTSRRN